MDRDSSGYSIYDRITYPMKIARSFLRGRPLLVHSDVVNELRGVILVRSPQAPALTLSADANGEALMRIELMRIERIAQSDELVAVAETAVGR